MIDFHRVFETSPVPMAIFEPEECELVTVNASFLKEAHASRDEIARDFAHALPMHPDDPESTAHELRLSLARAKETRAPDELLVHGHLDGDTRERLWRVTSSPVLGGDGRLSGIVQQIEDVTGLAGIGWSVPRDTRHLNDHLRIAQRIANIGSWQLNINDDTRVWSSEMYRLAGIRADTDLSIDVLLDVVHPDDRQRFIDARNRFVAGRGLPADLEHRIVRRNDGAVRHVRERIEAIFDESGRPSFLFGTLQDITEQHLAEEQLKIRTRQQFMVSELGQMALKETELPAVYDAAARLVAETLDVEYCKLLKQLPDGQHMKLLAGFGWRQGLVGTAVLDIERNSQAGYALRSDQPIIVEDVGNDVRFNDPSMLREHGVISGISVIVHGEHGPWGVLGAHTIRKRKFGQDDINFVQSVANIIAEATRRTENEQALRRSEARTRSVIDTALDAVVAIDTENRIIEWNPQAEAIFGWTREEVMGELMYELLVPENYREAHVRGVERFLSTGEGPFLNRRVEVSALHRDGHEIPIELSIAVVRSGNETNFSAFLRDISERKQAERRIREREERLRQQAALLDKAQDAIIVSDMDMHITFWNKGAERLYGWTAEEITGRRKPELLEKNLPAFEKSMKQLLATGEWAGAMEQKRKDGSTFAVEAAMSLVTDDDGVPVRILCINTDISKRLALEAQLRQSQRLEAVGQLTGGIAHDFNNLLTVILGNAELMAEQLPHGSSAQRMASMTRKAAMRGADLTHGLLAFARRQALDPKAVDVKHLVAGMKELLGHALPENIEIDVMHAKDPWSAFADPAQLESVILNLALNARDAMPRGGRLTIETSNVHLDETYTAKHAELAPGRYVMLAVSDTGTGIPPDVIDRVFDPFFTTKGQGKGTGLGLSMAYGFAKQSDGHITIYSEPGQGTTVKLYLPRAAQPEEIVEPEQTVEEHGHGQKILVVEDDDLVRSHAESQLEVFGYTVISAASGPEALEILEKETDIELLFTDVIMSGGMNGPELARTAKQRWPGLKVLYTSGYTENAIVHHGRLDEGVQLLQKPYRRHDLARKVHAVLSQNGEPH